MCTVCMTTTQAEAANWEMLELLADFLPKRFPDRFTRSGDALINHSTGDIWNLASKDQDPLEICALLVQVCQRLTTLLRTYSCCLCGTLDKAARAWGLSNRLALAF